MRKAIASFLFASLVITPVMAETDSVEIETATPIKHVIVVLAENRSFDHVFATYRPPAGQTVFNLLSEGIVTEDGTPAPNFSRAMQYRAQVTDVYDPAPENKEAYATLPPLMTGSAPSHDSEKEAPFYTAAQAAEHDHGLSDDAVRLLTIGATGLPRRSIDTRLPNGAKLPNGPYQLTPAIPYNAYASSPVHRFFQMWQQMDCSAKHASVGNPSGCLNDLFPWVEVSVGAGSNGKPQADVFDDTTTGEGSTAMGFYNVAHGDVPYLRELAEQFALSDNYHQAALGGTGANHIMLGSGDMIWYSDGNGNAAVPPADEIENPDPQPGTNNFYKEDGYKGGSYVACADAGQPGVGPIRAYLASLPANPNPRCEAERYYLVNNYSPGYIGSGKVNDAEYTVPPSDLRTIADALLEKQIPFRYYGEGWNGYLRHPKESVYCDICNFMQYTTQVMTGRDLRRAHIADLDAFYGDLEAGTLPAVVFIKPSELNDGHPASSRLDIFEAFARRIVDAVQAKPDLWADTAILITFDEAGGYWDSGYVQPLDFFGDGPRVPLIAVSPFASGGRVVHSYTDHVSILKFIERNWNIAPLTQRSRDNLPNPVTREDNIYVPANSPAIGDLMDMFHFN